MSIDMKKSTTIISSVMIRPSEETPSGCLWLSRLDMMRRQPYSHTRLLLIYKPNKIENDSNPSSLTSFFDTNILKKSLGRVIVPYYTMAGRLKINDDNGRYEIDCNAEGVVFIEAETTNLLTDLGHETDPNIKLRNELFATCDYSKGLCAIPLLMVQLTRFKCGGVCLGYSQHHHVVDGPAHVGFINSWARLAKGLDLTAKPVHDRLGYLAPRDPPQIKLLDLDYMEPAVPPLYLPGTLSTTNCTFKLSKALIEALKKEAMSSQELSSHDLSTFNVLAGHVWRCVCKARKLAEDQDVKLYMPVNGRPILKLPSGYAGNAIVCAATKAKVRDVTHKPLWYAISKVCEALMKRKDSENFRSAIDYIESQPSLEPLIRGENNSTCPNLWINSWARLPFDESDFGWGAPTSIRHGGVKFEGQSVFLPSENGDGSLLLSINLFTVHIDLFEKYLYELGPPCSKL